MTSCTGSVRGGFWGFEKKLVESSFGLGRKRLTFACSPRPCGRCCMWFGADGKVVIERLCLSPYVEKPFNSKVIKSFVPELRSRKCFLCLGDFVCYLYVRYKHSMYVSHISVSWVCYNFVLIYLQNA